MDLGIQSLPGLQDKFQASQGYRVRPGPKGLLLSESLNSLMQSPFKFMICGAWECLPFL